MSKTIYFELQIYPQTVALLTDEQLKELGVTSMGERATLRTLCRNVERCKLLSPGYIQYNRACS